MFPTVVSPDVSLSLLETDRKVMDLYRQEMGQNTDKPWETLP